MPIHDWTRVGAGIFHDFHHEWVSALKRALNTGLLPGDYYALAERAVLGFGPVFLTDRFTATTEIERYADKRSRIVIRHASSDRVAAILEIVSPANKTTQNALRSFVAKALELLDAGVHLLVVDLFPPGPRDPQGVHGAIWSEITEGGFELPREEPLTLVAYPAGEVKKAYVEPVATGGTLPDMPLFLAPDHYILVPLEASYQDAFEAVPKRWQEELGP
ncbi:MAG: DUF4058 family protein [Planctomycetes bacterium]|nr:DUF4058 family protein [Planctomycetota bacterium]MBL7039954.1 DUF4058 family protein [Pirellulaceae bacterium]